MLYNKWWGKDLEGGLYCPKQGTNLTKASALNLANIGGVFVVLLCGLAVALMVDRNRYSAECLSWWNYVVGGGVGVGGHGKTE